MTFNIPVKTKNPLNGSQGRTRGAMIATANRRKKERETARLVTLAALPFVPGRGEKLWDPVVTLTRLYERDCWKMDGDGLEAALKSVRDGVAAAMGVDDGADEVTWKYSQRKSERRAFGVEVEIS